MPNTERTAPRRPRRSALPKWSRKDVPDSVGEHYEEMTELGANVKGEGRI